MVAWHLRRTALGSVARSRAPARWPVSRDPRPGEALAQRVQKLPITRRGARQPLRNKRGMEVGEKLPVQALAAFEERFWICSDCRPARPVPATAFSSAGIKECGARKMSAAQSSANAASVLCRLRSVVHVC
jgi:hypothetical protein